jgi:hypothetical protein
VILLNGRLKGTAYGVTRDRGIWVESLSWEVSLDCRSLVIFRSSVSASGRFGMIDVASGI